ncbi:MAG: phosphoglycerate mutase family protein [Nocardia sp.]|uniref:histidine phosphatase family protein n=1 Tax=Nocardia sp. TaxID=1821 RepID=UPI00262C4E9C|nr:histidine phosphatase family protein [Nocardia sp.]MCU1641778.1 phosphoglycerate mutase family protein [Nocardia sp.]
MSAVTRLTLISHAMTEAMAAARFAADEPLSELGLRTVQKADHSTLRADLIQVGPEARTAQTAAQLALTGSTEPALRDLDCGSWTGSGMADLQPEQLMGWLTDPNHVSHDGESITDLIERVRAWMDTLVQDPQRILAVTHPAVVRATILIALSAPATSFWRIDIPPLSATTLHQRGGAWTLRETALPL